MGPLPQEEAGARGAPLQWHQVRALQPPGPQERKHPARKPGSPGPSAGGKAVRAAPQAGVRVPPSSLRAAQV